MRQRFPSSWRVAPTQQHTSGREAVQVRIVPKGIPQAWLVRYSTLWGPLLGGYLILHLKEIIFFLKNDIMNSSNAASWRCDVQMTSKMML